MISLLFFFLVFSSSFFFFFSFLRSRGCWNVPKSPAREIAVLLTWHCRRFASSNPVSLALIQVLTASRIISLSSFFYFYLWIISYGELKSFTNSQCPIVLYIDIGLYAEFHHLNLIHLLDNKISFPAQLLSNYICIYLYIICACIYIYVFLSVSFMTSNYVWGGKSVEAFRLFDLFFLVAICHVITSHVFFVLFGLVK